MVPCKAAHTMHSVHKDGGTGGGGKGSHVVGIHVTHQVLIRAVRCYMCMHVEAGERGVCRWRAGSMCS